MERNEKKRDLLTILFFFKILPCNLKSEKVKISFFFPIFFSHFSQFKMEMLESLYKYAKFLYECGNYLAASTYLDFYRILIPQHDPNYLNALYGKLASEILMQSWDHARDDLNRLRAYIDSDPFETDAEVSFSKELFVIKSLLGSRPPIHKGGKPISGKKNEGPIFFYYFFLLTS